MQVKVRGQPMLCFTRVFVLPIKFRMSAASVQKKARLIEEETDERPTSNVQRPMSIIVFYRLKKE